MTSSPPGTWVLADMQILGKMNASVLKRLLETAGPLLLGMILLSCAESEREEFESRPDADLQFEGVVQYRQIEGGAWVIESTTDNSATDSNAGDKGISGTTYEPENLPEKYQEEGLRVRVWADRLEGQASIRMAGPIISIKRIETRQ